VNESNAYSGGYTNYTITFEEGTHLINATINDTSGRSASTSTHTLIVDLTNPTLEYNTSTETSNTIIPNNYVIVNLTSTDTYLDNVTAYIYNSTWSSTQTNTASFLANFTSLADGLYYFNASATDIAGNRNTTPTRNITIDTTEPTITFITPFDPSGSILARNYTYMNVSVTDTHFANVTVYIYNTTQLVSNITNPIQPFFVNFSNLPNGVYYYNASALDLVNNRGISVTNNVTIAVGSPAVNLVEPTPLANEFVDVNSVTVNATADSSVDIEVCTLEWQGSNETMNRIGSGISVTCNQTKTGLTDGSYTFKVYANNTASVIGNSSTRTFTVDLTDPVANYAFPTPTDNNVNGTNTQTINISHTETNPDTLVLRVNGIVNQTVPYSGSYTNFTLTFADGIYTYNATLNDSAGRSIDIPTRTLTIDTTPPTITITEPDANAYVGYDILLAATVTDALAGVHNVTFEIINSSLVRCCLD